MYLNFNQLRSFYFAAKLSSISQAAKNLMVTPAAVTMQIKQLEADLGFNLMYREGRYIKLTEQGKGALQKAESVFREIQLLEDFLEEISKSRSGELRIGCHEVPAKYIMPQLIDMFNQRHPNIKVIMELGKTSVMLNKIQKHEIPLALVVISQSHPKFLVKPVIKDEIILIAAKSSKIIPGNEISISDLQSLPLIMPEKDSGLVQRVNSHLKNFNITPNVIMEIGSLDILKGFVMKDKALGFVEIFAVRDQLKNKQFKKIKIKEGSPTIEFGIGYLKERRLSPITQAFLNMLDEKKLKHP